MRTRPRSKIVMNRKSRRCNKCGKLVRRATRCKTCSQALPKV